MNIPTASDFPQEFDTDENLFLVHDFLRGFLVCWLVLQITISNDNNNIKTMISDADAAQCQSYVLFIQFITRLITMKDVKIVKEETNRFV